MMAIEMADEVRGREAKRRFTEIHAIRVHTISMGVAAEGV